MGEKLSSFGIGKNAKTFVVIAALIAIPVIVGGYAQVQKRNEKTSKVLAATQVNDLLVKVGKLIDLPNETPTVATVSDVSKLSGQEFFAKALNGDKVIIFPNAKKAILYRPSTNKIVEVAVYNPPAASPQPSQVPSPTPTPLKSLRQLIGNPTSRPTPQTSPVPTGEKSTSPSPEPSNSPTPQQ